MLKRYGAKAMLEREQERLIEESGPGFSISEIGGKAY